MVYVGLSLPKLMPGYVLDNKVSGVDEVLNK